jgi:hypothetical protein
LRYGTDEKEEQSRKGRHSFVWLEERMVDGMAAASSKASQSASYSEKPPSSTLLTEKQLVKDLPAGVVTLRKLRYWRAMRVGPPWSKVGRVVV